MINFTYNFKKNAHKKSRKGRQEGGREEKRAGGRRTNQTLFYSFWPGRIIQQVRGLL